MASKRRSFDMPPAELPMTPMIDIVFQLLIYFIVTIKPIDVFAHLDVMRPSPEKQQDRVNIPKVVRVGVFERTFSFMDEIVTEKVLGEKLQRAAALDPGQTVLLLTSSYSPHGQLIKALNQCAKAKLTNLSVVSTN